MSRIFSAFKSYSHHFCQSALRMGAVVAPTSLNIIRYKSKTRGALSLDVKEVLASPEEKETKQKLSSTIEVPMEMSELKEISGIPEEQLANRRVRIHQSVKNAMQSGTNNVSLWKIDFNVQQRWENPLMGWTSTGDPLSNMDVRFCSQEDAIQFCEGNGWRWYVETPPKPKEQRIKNYGINFAFDKRTRVHTK